MTGPYEPSGRRVIRAGGTIVLRNTMLTVVVLIAGLIKELSDLVVHLRSVLHYLSRIPEGGTHLDIVRLRGNKVGGDLGGLHARLHSGLGRLDGVGLAVEVVARTGSAETEHRKESDVGPLCGRGRGLRGVEPACDGAAGREASSRDGRGGLGERGPARGGSECCERHSYGDDRGTRTSRRRRAIQRAELLIWRPGFVLEQRALTRDESPRVITSTPSQPGPADVS